MAQSERVIPVLMDGAFDGPSNMARDEALLLRVGARAIGPTLRVYQWRPPTVSLGYFQSYDEYLAQPESIRRMAVVRRLTGGGAIVHADELTYSLTLPNDHEWLRGGATRLYEVVHDGAVEALESFGVGAGRAGCTDDSGPGRGPFLCFARRHCLDLVVGTQKVLGSAQRRTREATLQHGSLQLQALAWGDRPCPDPAELAMPLVRALAARTGWAFEPSRWDDETLALAESLRAKYAGADWTKRK